ncbi:MAG: SDR family NAD(P)-dependent oxidoreductase [Myxococcota bacterium]
MSVVRQRVIVTGAGSGLGDAIARQLAGEGYDVLGTVREAARAHTLTEQAQGRGLSLSYRPLDLGERAQVERLGAELGAQPLDVLVHNAGMGVFGAVEDVDDTAAALQMAVNFFGPLELTRRLLPALRQAHGRILFVGSLAGRISLPFQACYSASKAALAALSDALRIELRPHGVQVCCIEPGDFATAFTAARRVSQATTPYASAAQRCLLAVERQERSGAEAALVAQLVSRLCRSRRLAARYPVGRWARTLALLRGVLPDAWAEAIVRTHYEL